MCFWVQPCWTSDIFITLLAFKRLISLLCMLLELLTLTGCYCYCSSKEAKRLHVHKGWKGPRKKGIPWETGFPGHRSVLCVHLGIIYVITHLENFIGQGYRLGTWKEVEQISSFSLVYLKKSLIILNTIQPSKLRSPRVKGHRPIIL